MNGDGRADWVRLGSGDNMQVLINTPSGWVNKSTTFGFNSTQADFDFGSNKFSGPYFLEDYNRDGLMDVVNTMPDPFSASIRVPDQILISTGSGGFGALYPWPTAPAVEYSSGDFDGDGRYDILLTGDDWINNQDGNGCVMINPPVSFATNDGSTMHNVDGFVATLKHYPATGCPFGGSVQSFPVVPYTGQDFNGDGRVELMVPHTSAGGGYCDPLQYRVDLEGRQGCRCGVRDRPDRPARSRRSSIGLGF